MDRHDESNEEGTHHRNVLTLQFAQLTVLGLLGMMALSPITDPLLVTASWALAAGATVLSAFGMVYTHWRSQHA